MTVNLGFFSGLGPRELSNCCIAPGSNSSDIILSLWCLSLRLADQPCISHMGGVQQTPRLCQRAFSGGGEKGYQLKRRGPVQDFGWVGCKVLSGRMQTGLKSDFAPSRQAPRRTLAPAFPRYLAVLHRHWLSPP